MIFLRYRNQISITHLQSSMIMETCKLSLIVKSNLKRYSKYFQLNVKHSLLGSFVRKLMEICL